jgi:hypothetical protein
MKVKFQGEVYQIVITDHAEVRMKQRGVSLEEISIIINSGKIINKEIPNKYWVYKRFLNRTDNLICLSISIENPYLIVISTLVNWRPL